jgi:hypothetical protein
MPELPLETDSKEKPLSAPVASPGIIAGQAVDSPFEEAPALRPLDLVMLAFWTLHFDLSLNLGSA